METDLSGAQFAPSIGGANALSMTQATGRITPLSFMPGVIPVFEGGVVGPVGAGPGGGGPPILGDDLTDQWLKLVEGCAKVLADAIKAAGVEFKEALSNVSSSRRNGQGRESQEANAEKAYEEAMKEAAENFQKNRKDDFDALSALGTVDAGRVTEGKSPHEVALAACDARLVDEGQAIEVMRTKGDKSGKKISDSEAKELAARAALENKVNHRLVDKVFGNQKWKQVKPKEKE
jgi:hypothetical protein